MTQDDFQKVMQTVQNLDNYTSTSNTLNTHRTWHIRWARLYEAVKQELSQLVEAEPGTPKETPATPPSKPGPKPGKKEKKPC